MNRNLLVSLLVALTVSAAAAQTEHISRRCLVLSYSGRCNVCVTLLR
jgi:hypothetical protein